MLPKFNSNSNDHLSLIFFGGKIIIEELQPVLNEDGTFKRIKKTGGIKIKKVKIEKQIKGIGLKPLEQWKTKKTGIFQTNKNVLQIIANECEE